MVDVGPKKRPRPVVSCLRCRDKKLKCDRASPCQNCIKAQCAEACAYNQFPGSSSPSVKSRDEAGSSTSNHDSYAVDELRQRVARLEELVIKGTSASTHSTAQSSPASSGITTRHSEKSPKPFGTLVIKGSRSRFHGQNDRTTLLDQFQEVKDFLENLSRDRELGAMARQVQFLHKQSQCRPQMMNEAESAFSQSLLNLKQRLPPKPVCDQLLEVYTDYFERAIRVLHIPTFRRQYNRFWTNTDPEISNSSCIVPLITAVSIVANEVNDRTISGEYHDYRVYLEGPAMQALQTWVDELGRRQEAELPRIQVEILVHMVKLLRQFRPEQIWRSSGTLLRSAMIMGLHTNPSRIPKISPFYAEIRRRIWATVLELDLQASITAGMPMTAPLIGIELPEPANIDDNEFDETSEVLPSSKPQTSLTDNSCQSYLASYLPERLKLMSLLQSSNFSVDEALEQGKKVEEVLARKPPAFAIVDTGETTHNPGDLLQNYLLDLCIRRLLLCLYRSLLMQGHPDGPVLYHAREVCVASSLAILSHERQYIFKQSGQESGTPPTQRCFLYPFHKTDVVLAAVNICQHIEWLHNRLAISDQLADHIGVNEGSLVRAVEETLESLIQRIEKMGSDLKDVFFLAIALDSARIPRTADNKSSRIHEGAKRLLATCHDRLMHAVVSDQKNPATAPKRFRTAEMGGPFMSSPASLNTADIVTSTNPTSDPLVSLQVPEQLQYQSQHPFGLVPNEFGLDLSTYQGDAFGSDLVYSFDIDNWNWNFSSY